MIKYFSEATGYSNRFIFLILISGLLIRIIASWNSLGFFHYDEHYQILEFAAYKAGISPKQDLAWEFEAQIRPTLQPWIAYFIIKLHAFFRPHDSFTVAGILRLLTVLLGFCTSLLVAAASFKWFTDLRIRKTMLLLSLFLWFLVFMDVRFSSESWAGIFFFCAIALLILKDAFYMAEKPINSFFVLFCGFLFGLSLVFRLQMILLLPGFAIWCIFIARTPYKTLILLITGGIFAIALGFVADYLFYGNWVNTAYRYFTTNILQGKASEFGVSPWWFYIPEFLVRTQMPFSIAIFVLVLLAWIRYPRHLLTFTCVPFVLLHMAIAHKELRFLFPIAHVLPVFIALGLQFIFSQYKSYYTNRIFKWAAICVFAFLTFQNILLLIKSSTAPANGILQPLRYVYRIAKTQEIDIVIADKYEYDFLFGLPMNFYLSKNMHVSTISNADTIEDQVAKSGRPVYFLLRSRGLSFPEKYSQLEDNVEDTYYCMPGLYRKINFNNWLSRTSVWRIYKFSDTAQ